MLFFKKKLGHVNENLNSDWFVVYFGRGYKFDNDP